MIEQTTPEGRSSAVEAMVKRVNRFKIDPQFTQQVEKRRSKFPDFTQSDQQVLRSLMVLIAYSNNANAERVTRLVESRAFESIFRKYFVENNSELTADTIISDCWRDLTAIRFKYKVDAWVRCARCFNSIQNQYGSFMKYMMGVGLPNPLESERDIRTFWDGFNRIRAYFLELRLPYFGNFTSLCHLLMDLGFDCAKPDLIVMRAAVDLGLVPPPQIQKNSGKSRPHSQESLKQAVKTIQVYAVGSNSRAPVVDLYFLIHGKQSDAVGLVDASYYSQIVQGSTTA